jgi:hypothetical protein
LAIDQSGVVQAGSEHEHSATDRKFITNASSLTHSNQHQLALTDFSIALYTDSNAI